MGFLENSEDCSFENMVFTHSFHFLLDTGREVDKENQFSNTMIEGPLCCVQVPQIKSLLTVDCLKVLSLHPHKEGRQRASAQKGLFPY